MGADVPKVSVCVITYNHARYLAECLQGILDQKTDFPFEVIVGDDCSTDGTQDILRDFAARYPDIIRPIYQPVNTGGGPNFMQVHAAARGEYIAHVDGDDLVLPGKLQRQSDHLDANPGCNVVWHRVARLRQKDGVQVLSHPPATTSGHMTFTKADCLAIGTIGVHSSKMYRARLRDHVTAKVVQQYDYEMDLLQIEGGTGTLLTEVLGIYRITGTGLTSTADSRSRRMLDAVLKAQYISDPAHRPEISALFLVLAIVDVKNRRSFWRRSLANYLSHFQVASLRCFIRYAPIKLRLRKVMG